TDPQKPSQLGKGTTDKAGHATLTYSNGKEPRIDVVQATFTDGLEVHKSNRSFLAWQSGTPATAIASPAAITVTPGCFQPATAVLGCAPRAGRRFPAARSGRDLQDTVLPAVARAQPTNRPTRLCDQRRRHRLPGEHDHRRAQLGSSGAAVTIAGEDQDRRQR